MVDNPMLNFSDPPEWEQITADYCKNCNKFAEMCDCEEEQAQIEKVDAVECPTCQETVLDTDDAIAEHVREGCEPYFDEDSFFR